MDTHIVMRSVCLATIAVVAVFVPGLIGSAQSPGIVTYLTHNAYGAIFISATHHACPNRNGFGAPNTNAVASDIESDRIDDIAAHSHANFGRFSGGPPTAIDGVVVADVAQHVVVIRQNPKGSGGEQYAIVRYAPPLPSTIPARRLPAMTIAGIGPGSSADDVFMRFGEPYSITEIVRGSALGIEKTHELQRPSWFLTDLGDGVYNYAGPVPNKAQSCIANFAIVIVRRKVLGIRQSIEC